MIRASELFTNSRVRSRITSSNKIIIFIKLQVNYYWGCIPIKCLKALLINDNTTCLFYKVVVHNCKIARKNNIAINTTLIPFPGISKLMQRKVEAIVTCCVIDLGAVFPAFILSPSANRVETHQARYPLRVHGICRHTHAQLPLAANEHN